MFERFTDRARRVLVFAQEEAIRLGHEHVGTEHLLLGIVREGEGVAAKALEALGVGLPEVGERVGAVIGRGEAPVAEQPDFTLAAKRVLELALREAQQLGHDYIGTEHVLLGMVREGEGVAAQVLGQLGTSLPAVRSQVIQSVSGRAVGEPGQGAAMAPGGDQQAWQEDGWTLLASGTESTWRALGLARQEAAVDAHPAVEVSDLVMGVLRAGDPQVNAALEEAGAVTALDDLDPDATDAADPPALPLSAQARDALARAVRRADDDAAALGPVHLLLGCLSVLDAEAVSAVAARLGVEAGQLMEHLSQPR